jgi:hypothetical protein
MPKTFYTERDIVGLHARGVMAIDVNDDVVLTDLAHEKALSLGMRVARSGKSTGAASPNGSPSQDEIVARVKSAVIARLGKDVDTALLDTVIARVLAQLNIVAGR